MLRGLRPLPVYLGSAFGGSTVFGASPSVPDAFLQGIASAAAQRGWNPEFPLRVMASESGLDPSAAHSTGGATGLIQWEPQNGHYPLGDGTQQGVKNLGFMGQLGPAITWWDQEQGNRPYETAGDFYAAVFLPGRRLSVPQGAPLTRRGESFYDENQLLDPNKTGVITSGTLETFADRVLSTPRYQQIMSRMQELGLLSSSSFSSEGNAGISGFPWLLTGVFVAAGVGGTMLLGQTKTVRMPRWIPRWMKA